MKTISIIIIIIFTSVIYSQNEESIIDEQHRTDVFIEQNLYDFNAKYHKVFIASYKDFSTIIKSNDNSKKPIIDFDKGINETISNTDEKKLSFSVSFTSEQNEIIARGMYKNIIDRILTVSPKGLVKKEEENGNYNITTIKFNPKEADKSAHQPVTTVKLNFETLTIEITVYTPEKQ